MSTETATPPAPPPDDTTLIFQWERRSHAHWRLTGLIALSLLVHAVTFYVLQVAYTPTGSQPPPPAQVMLLTMDSPDDPPALRAQVRALTRWLAMSDPSLITQPVPPSAREIIGSLGLAYIPSYKAMPPAFKPLDAPPAGNALSAPPYPHPPGPVPVPMPPYAVRIAAQTGGQETRVTLTGGIETRLDSPLPTVEFRSTQENKPLEPTVFIVGVRAEGGMPLLFREAKSGDDAADDHARDFMTRLPFSAVADQPGDETVAWGRARFDWGGNVYKKAGK